MRPRRYVIPGGSAGHFQRDGYVLDVGASMMFGMGEVRLPSNNPTCTHVVGCGSKSWGAFAHK